MAVQAAQVVLAAQAVQAVLAALQPNECPTLPKGACQWRGTAIKQHLEDEHEDCIKNRNTVRVDLRKDFEMFRVLCENGRYFALKLAWERTKGITISLKETRSNCYTFNDYTLKIHSLDFEICIAYKVTSERYFISYTTLKCISMDHVLLEIDFGEKLNKTDKTILDTLNCPVCLKTMQTGNICQCTIGHSFCETCFGNLSQCPLCRDELGTTINYKLMQLRTDIFRSCENKSLGCNFQGLPSQIVQHETFCQRFVCSLNFCKFTGSEQDLIQHCLSDHKHFALRKNNISWSSTDGNDEEYLVYAYGRIFVIFRESVENDVLWTVKLHGSKEEAEEYSFSVRFQCGNDEMVLKSVCQSVDDDDDDASGLRIPHYQLKRFESGGVYKCCIEITNRFI